MVRFMAEFFMNTPHERMMAQEAQTTQNKAWQLLFYSSAIIDAYARKAVDRNGLYIRLETADLTSQNMETCLSQAISPLSAEI